ncbi:hypothetical protein FRACYDRAFT_235603 [Fragilariopsis cylindrus CCMP1102]|uniref:Uncharacterized protein n=1 Tax=Fragilariopsis cylindrus CCMP1102 TaxID=635003 RepID=A0A1E7FN37_9STRA|nr:hypothetical protein FRACYDRAFT_235603 [Fragilariopsis cylindrus CCMP1102]|eukprot:OEU19544.1 hypothetical protein FRACYDRAFT_235603 [Fragilariopsis cylindrus CCMP1102]
MKLPHVQFTSPAEWNPNLNDDHRTSEEMIKNFPPIPQDTINNFYVETGKINYEYLYRRKNSNVEIEHDDDDSVGTMPGLQVRYTENEYWEDFLLDDVNQRLIYQGIFDYCEQNDINANDIATVMTPLKPRYSVPTPIDYESKRKYFAHLKLLPPATYLHKMFKSPNPSANLKRRDEADVTDMIYSNTNAINTTRTHDCATRIHANTNTASSSDGGGSLRGPTIRISDTNDTTTTTTTNYISIYKRKYTWRKRLK